MKKITVTYAMYNSGIKQAKGISDWFRNELKNTSFKISDPELLLPPTNSNPVSEYCFEILFDNLSLVQGFSYINNLAESEKILLDNMYLIAGSINIMVDVDKDGIGSKEDIVEYIKTVEAARYKTSRQMKIKLQNMYKRLDSIENNINMLSSSIDSSGAMLAFTFLEELNNALKAKKLPSVDTPKLYH